MNDDEQIPQSITRVIDSARAEGFAGVLESYECLGDLRHELYLVRVRFASGDVEPYVVASDRHDGGGNPVLLALSDTVHCLQNMTDAERWELSSRDPVSKVTA